MTIEDIIKENYGTGDAVEFVKSFLDFAAKYDKEIDSGILTDEAYEEFVEVLASYLDWIEVED